MFARKFPAFFTLPPLPRPQTPFHYWLIFLGSGVAVGLGAASLVVTQGLSVTHLSDLVPWGLWIAIDLSSIALSAGAFVLCAVVHLLGLKQYAPVARTATFIGLIGYSMAVLCLMLDIGRPDRFWHALVFWNPHSVLWEVTMCVTLYFTVLALETAPLLGEAPWFRARWPRLAHWLEKVHHLAPILAVVGLCLSMLHQSSLGAAYGVLKARPVWYRPDLSVLFMASALAAGPALTVLASMLAARFSAQARVNDALLERLAQVIGWILLGYAYLRFWDALSMNYTYWPGRTEGLNLLTSGELSFNFWIGEVLLGMGVPLGILLRPSWRRQPWLRMLALALVVGGVVAYRWDTNLAGQLVMLTYLPQEIVARYTAYMPSLVEYLTGAGIVAYGVLAFTLGVRYLHVVQHPANTEA